MKYLGEPAYDDVEIIRGLARMRNLGSYPALQAMLGQVEEAYRQYIAARGNVLAIGAPLPLGEDLKEGLRGDYARRLAALAYIRAIREDLSPDICPMCGGPHPHQVDHVAPKAEYPEYSLFSRNLVPACECNGRKSANFRDVRAGGRILHPYFDRLLDERLVYVAMEDDVALPRMRVEIVIGHSNDRAVRYHVEKVLKKTGVVKWAAQEWTKLKRMPKSMLHIRKDVGEPVHADEVLEAVLERVRHYDAYYGTPNNWNSMFFYGVQVRGRVCAAYLARLAEQDQWPCP